MNRPALASLALPALVFGMLATMAVLDRPEDLLTLTSGKEIEGYVLRDLPDEVVMLVDTRKQSYERDDIASVRSPIPHLSEFARRLETTSATNAAANVALAVWCDEQGMPHEADFLRWRAIAADWHHAPAHEALEHRQRSGEWQVRVGRSWLDRKRFEKDARSWRSAHQVSTSLVQVRGNVPLRELTDTVVEWTRYYQGYFELWGDEVGMPHASQWMTVHLHGDEKSFPTAGAGDAAYFLPDQNRVVVDTTRLAVDDIVRRQMMGQVLYSTYRNAENGQGSAPPWMTEALALYLGAALPEVGPPDADRALFTDTDWFTLHAESDDPDSLSRILNASGEELTNVPGYQKRVAQAFTLLDYCMNADGGAHREKFYAYVKGTMSGRVSPTHFQNTMGFENRDFAEPWQAWARTRAKQRASGSGTADEGSDEGDER